MLKKIEFDSIGFRNLKDISINFSPRLNVIAGHNGIGKSTILGLIANGSELKKNKTLLNKDFRADFGELFFLDYYEDFKNREPEPSRANLTYTILGNDIIKNCEVSGTQKEAVHKTKYKKFMVKVPTTELTERQTAALKPECFYVYRMRVIPRTINSSVLDKTFLEENSIGNAAKIPIPTIYLGMSRMSPIGEFGWTAIQQKATAIPPEIDQFIYQIFDSIIPFSDPINLDEKKTFAHSFNDSNKQSIVPDFGHSSLSISLGQDSLSTIATALASFKHLQIELGENYQGGILIIDEVEAGLHPRAQRKLIQTLKVSAKELKLQIIMTSHSLTIIKETLDENTSKEYRADDVIYLMDTNVPYVMENPSYLKIKNDMLLEEVQTEIIDEPTVIPPPKMYVYFEDLEAFDFCVAILDTFNIKDTFSYFGRELELVPAKLGCHNLLSLSKTTPHFQNSIIILDSDINDLVGNSKEIKKSLLNYSNVVTLPVNDSESAFHSLPPDKLAYCFLLDKYINRNTNREFWHKSTSNRLTTNFFLDHLKDIQKHYSAKALPPINNLEDVKKLHRDPMKNWYNAQRETLKTFNIFGLWATENEIYCKIFLDSLVQTIDKLINGQHAI